MAFSRAGAFLTKGFADLNEQTNGLSCAGQIGGMACLILLRSTVVSKGAHINRWVDTSKLNHRECARSEAHYLQARRDLAGLLSDFLLSIAHSYSTWQAPHQHSPSAPLKDKMSRSRYDKRDKSSILQQDGYHITESGQSAILSKEMGTHPCAGPFRVTNNRKDAMRSIVGFLALTGTNAWLRKEKHSHDGPLN